MDSLPASALLAQVDGFGEALSGVDPLVVVLVALVAYTLVAMALQARGLLPESVRVSGPITTLHTQRGIAFLNWAASPKRFWRAWSNVGLGVALVVMLGSFFGVLASAYGVLRQPDSQVLTQPQDVLVIPGVNSFLPLSVAPEILLGLLIGLVVHEGGHGLLCRVEDIDVESVGLVLIALIPGGAFVEPDEESSRNADRGSRTRMYAAGVTNNFTITAVAFALLFGPVVGAIAPAAGVPVYGVIPGGAAADAGIERGDVITGVAGEPVTSESELDAALADAGGTVAVSLADGETVRVERSPVVTRAVVGGPTGFPTNTTIAAINGTPVRTEGALERALENRSVAVFETANGTERTAPAGAYVTRIVSGGPLANASGAGGEPAVITRVDGERTVDRATLSDTLDDTEPNETVSAELFIAGEPKTVTVTLGENPNDPGTGFLGVSGIQSGISGLVVDDLGIEAYPAAAYLAFLGGGSGGGPVGGFLTGIVGTLFLPFASLLPTGLPYNFPGFVAPVTNFYTVTGPLSALGGTTFLLANVLFWTGWVNLNLGLFNCIPAFPLDGGHLLRSSTETVVARLPISGRRALASAVTTAVSLAMIGALLVMVFAPSLLSG